MKTPEKYSDPDNHHDNTRRPKDLAQSRQQSEGAFSVVFLEKDVERLRATIAKALSKSSDQNVTISAIALENKYTKYLLWKDGLSIEERQSNLVELKSDLESFVNAIK